MLLQLASAASVANASYKILDDSHLPTSMECLTVVAVLHWRWKLIILNNTPNFAIYSPETGFFKQSFTNSYKNVQVFLIIEASTGGNYPNFNRAFLPVDGKIGLQKISQDARKLIRTP